MAVQVGDKAPDFTLVNQDQEEVRLSDALKEGTVVLCFYPAAFSGVCTTQFTDLGKDVAAYTDQGARVFAISVDNAHSQRAFRESVGADGVDFLADFQPRGAVAEAYGTFLEDAGISNRAVFVIDRDGVIRHADVMPVPRDMPDDKAVKQAVESCTIG